MTATLQNFDVIKRVSNNGRRRFVSDRLSFRPITINGQEGYAVYPLQERSHWAQRGTLVRASDGVTWIVSPATGYADARPDFESAMALVLATFKR